MSVYKCPGCQRPEVHKMCPAWGTPFYMSGTLFTEELEKEWAEERRLNIEKLRNRQYERLDKRITVANFKKELDNTPYESDDFDRGRTHGAKYIVQYISKMLDGEYTGEGGPTNLPEWDALRKRLVRLVRDSQLSEDEGIAYRCMCNDRRY